jgi:hypothetical protein
LITDTNNYNEAKLRSHLGDYLLQESLHEAKSMSTFPLVTFSMANTSFFPDYLTTYTSFLLLSKKLTDILKEFQVSFELFKVRIVDKYGIEIQHPYSLFNLLEMEDATDKEQSIINDKKAQIVKIVIKESVEKAAKPMFRFMDNPGFIAMHRNLVGTLKINRVTGCNFTPVEEFQVGTAFDMPDIDDMVEQY